MCIRDRNPVTSVIVNLAIVAIVWMGAGLANTGGLEQGQIIALVNLSLIHI